MKKESLLVIIEKYDGFVNYIYPIVQRKVKRYTEKGDDEKLSSFLASWHGNVQTADSHNLKLKIGGMIHG